MKILFYTCVFCGMLPFLLGACSEAGKEKTVEEEGVNTVLPDKKTEVTVVPLKRQTFYHELVSNGKMKAAEEAALNFETGGVVAKIYVKNGTRVKRISHWPNWTLSFCRIRRLRQLTRWQKPNWNCRTY